MFVINGVWHQVGWKRHLYTINDSMTAALRRDYLKCLKSTSLNLKPGIAWQKAKSVWIVYGNESYHYYQPLGPLYISFTKNYTIADVY